MKKATYIFTCLMTLFSASLSSLAHTSTTVLELTPEDFIIGTNSSGQVAISCQGFDYAYESDDNSPALPLIGLNIPLAPNSTVTSCNVKIDAKKLIKEDATVALAPDALPTSETGKPSSDENEFTGVITPETTLEYICSSNSPYGDVAHCCLCPFEYDSKNRVLYLVSKLTITIDYKYIAVAPPIDYYNPSLKESLKNIINVPYDPSVPTFFHNESDMDVSANQNELDYIIITTEKLMESFKVLKEFKTILGTRTQLLTVENITKKYREGDVQSKIKREIEHLYEVNGIKYVLLAGDVTEVPSRDCYIKKGSLVSTTPADNYFVCFQGSTNWDRNNNGVFGELQDSLNFFTPIYISRLPVNSKIQANGYIKNLMKYQMEGNSGGLYEILMSGMSLWKYLNNHSDAYWKANLLYNEAIKDNWSGKKKLLFDTFTDLSFDNEYKFSAENLQTALKCGYSFVDVMTHGQPTYYDVDYGSPYSDHNASSLMNNGYSIITTMACFTNAFDNESDPCLSESFIRNNESGVLAYFGSSRQGWGYDGEINEEIQLGPSLQYEKNFYLSLFRNSINENNFAKCVTAAKLANLNFCNKYNPYRWLQLTLNPIGDSEFPIYTNNPKILSEPKLQYTNRILTVAPGDGNTNITVTGLSDFGESFYASIKNTSKEFDIANVDSSVVISLTRPGYLPILYKGEYVAASSNAPEKMMFSKIDFDDLFTKVPFPLPNGGSIQSVSSSGTEITIRIKLDEYAKQPEIMVSDLIGNIIARRQLVQEEEIQTLTLEVNSGFHCVTLITNGLIIDQKKHLVQ